MKRTLQTEITLSNKTSKIDSIEIPEVFADPKYDVTFK